MNLRLFLPNAAESEMDALILNRFLLSTRVSCLHDYNIAVASAEAPAGTCCRGAAEKLLGDV